MLGNHQIGDILVVRVFIIIVFPIDEHNHICVLLNRVMHNEIVGNEVVERRHGEIVDIIDAIRPDCDDLIPVCFVMGRAGGPVGNRICRRVLGGNAGWRGDCADGITSADKLTNGERRVGRSVRPRDPRNPFADPQFV